MRFILAFLLLTTPCYAGQMKIKGEQVTYSEKYSRQEFTKPVQRTRLEEDLSTRRDVNNITIVNSCFYQEASPNAKKKEDIELHIFPEDMTGVKFYRCNLDNVYIPEGNYVDESCSNELIQIQNDSRDWILDKDTLKPVRVCNEDKWKMWGYSVEVEDIPETPYKDYHEIKRKVYENTEADYLTN